jgi:hypothetical protein
MEATKLAKMRLDSLRIELKEVRDISISSSGNMYIEFGNGMNLQISSYEINYQAIQYLEDELYRLKNEL